MSVSPLLLTADTAVTAKLPSEGSEPVSAFSDRPLCVHHQGDVTIVVYSSPIQEPKRLNHAILPSLHIMLVEEGKEIEGLVAILADYLSEESAVSDNPEASKQVLATIAPAAQTQSEVA